MSQENVALARKAIDALNRGDVDALLAVLSPDVVWEALEVSLGLMSSTVGGQGCESGSRRCGKTRRRASTSRSSG